MNVSIWFYGPRARLRANRVRAVRPGKLFRYADGVVVLTTPARPGEPENILAD